jgi:hypothetical protein
LLHVCCMYLEVVIIFYISVHVLVYQIRHEIEKQKFWISDSHSNKYLLGCDILSFLLSGCFGLFSDLELGAISPKVSMYLTETHGVTSQNRILFRQKVSICYFP